VTSDTEIPFNEWSKKRLAAEKKTATTRTESYGEAGDRFSAADIHGRIRRYELVDVREVPLREVAEEWYGREGCAAPDEFRRVWREIHPQRGWEPEREVYLHLFEEVDDE